MIRANLNSSKSRIGGLRRSAGQPRRRRPQWGWPSTTPAASLWTQKGSDNAGQGRILRADRDPAGRGGGEPQRHRSLARAESTSTIRRAILMYWTDRGDPPAGDTLNRAAADASEPPTINHLMEAVASHSTWRAAVAASPIWQARSTRRALGCAKAAGDGAREI